MYESPVGDSIRRIVPGKLDVLCLFLSIALIAGVRTTRPGIRSTSMSFPACLSKLHRRRCHPPN